MALSCYRFWVIPLRTSCGVVASFSHILAIYDFLAIFQGSIMRSKQRLSVYMMSDVSCLASIDVIVIHSYRCNNTCIVTSICI